MYGVKSLISMQPSWYIVANVGYPIGRVRLPGLVCGCFYAPSLFRLRVNIFRRRISSGEKVPKKDLELPDKMERLLADDQRYVLRL